MVNIEKLAGRFERDRESAQHEISRFKVAFDKDPRYALSWGTSVFIAVAKVRACDWVCGYMHNNAHVDPVEHITNMTDLIMDRILYSAKYPPQSTSPTSNLMEQYEMAAWAEALAILNNYKSYQAGTL